MSRWTILAVLFTARLSMAFQFQTVAALSPLLVDARGYGLADVGLLVGLYLAPGVVVAFPGSAIARRFGDRRVVGGAMILMLAGGALVGFGSGWEAVVAGRILAGVGGVVINIVMTKMVVDWFLGREISTAMAVFVNSWPLGIALALVTLPVVAAIGGLALASLVELGLIALGLALFLLVYRPAATAPDPSSWQGAGRSAGWAGLPLAPLGLAALVWALYNTALAMVFAFGPAMLDARGWTLAQASGATSLFMLMMTVSIPLGGYLADRTGRRDAVIVTSLLGYVLVMPVLPVAPAWAVPGVFVTVGLLFGLAAGPIMALPSDVLPPEGRALGMGIFFSIYYGVMMVGPALAGGMADRTGNPDVAILIGGGILVVCLAVFALFRRLTAATPLPG